VTINSARIVLDGTIQALEVIFIMRCAIYIYVLLTYLLTGYEQYENGTVRIDSVSLRDSGIYVCVAQNSAGTAMAQVRLQVQGFIYLLTHLLFPSSVN